MNDQQAPKMPREQIVYGEIVYWVTILACIFCTIGPVIAMANVKNNIMNPHYLFASIFAGKSAETVWQEVGGGFPGGHFYLKYFTYGDGFTQFGLALGCSVAVWALIAAAIVYFGKKNYLYAFLALWVTGLVVLSMLGLVGAH